MEIIDLNLVKKHLNIDESYTGDDLLIKNYINTAFEQLKADTGCEANELLDNAGELMPIPCQAVLFLVGDFYAYREDTYNGALTEQPKGYKRLVNILRHYE